MTPVQPADVARFQALIEERLGISCADWQEERLPSLLRERISKTHKDDPASYLSFLASVPLTHGEIGALAEQLTVGETYFFREPRQLDAMRHVALTQLLPKRRRQGAPIRILSAGCSSGEEAYTLALVLRELSGEAGPIDAQIIGVDMNPAAIRKAREAKYSAWSLRSTPGRVKDRWFSASGPAFRLVQEIRSMVTFEQRNLLHDDASFYRPDAFDIVFCRNVSIYFSPEATRKVIGKLEQSIPAGGFLFLGHSETLRGISDEFELMHTHETFYYQRRESVKTLPLDASPRPVSDRPKPQPDPEAGFDPEAWVSAIQRSSARIQEVTEKLAEPAQKDAQKSRGRRDAVMELFQAERFEEALALVRAIRASAPNDRDAELLEAVISFNQGAFAETERICRANLGEGARGAAAQYLLGLCRENDGARERAMHHYRHAIRLDPTFAMPHLHLGLLARRAGEIDTAREEMKLAAALVAEERQERILLFGGGFHRNALLELCRAELMACEEAS